MLSNIAGKHGLNSELYLHNFFKKSKASFFKGQMCIAGSDALNVSALKEYITHFNPLEQEMILDLIKQVKTGKCTVKRGVLDPLKVTGLIDEGTPILFDETYNVELLSGYEIEVINGYKGSLSDPCSFIKKSLDSGKNVIKNIGDLDTALILSKANKEE
ncbi:Uncharacterised protein [Candidatus Tiddalikarchaeum anstoanum]|nr:Uncharacterised protein [Candidatus Tiddalikarchaeum anstoanum]